MLKKRTKKFIAGAHCPSCLAVDVICLRLDTNEAFCVDCGYMYQLKNDKDKPKSTVLSKINIKNIT